MVQNQAVRQFAFSRGRLECDASGLRVGDAALLTRDDTGSWTPRDLSELRDELLRTYGFPVDLGQKVAGFAVVANALRDGDIAKAQIAALLLQLPDPPAVADTSSVSAERGRLADELAACGMLKADDDWEEKHPRTGAPPNPGWFALKPHDAEAENEPGMADGVSDLPLLESNLPIDLVANNSIFHDELQDKLLNDYNAAGNICYKEVGLEFNGVSARIDLLCKLKNGELIGVEIKTGNTDCTDNKKIVYPHAVLGYEVITSDQRITYFGFQLGQILPPFDIFMVYASERGAEYKVFSLRDLMARGLH